MKLAKFINPKQCLFRVAKSILNITGLHRDSDKAYSKANLLHMEGIHAKYIYSKHTNSKYQCLPYGIIVSSYKFGTVSRPLGYDINSLIKPFDISTWVLLFGSTLSLCIFFQISFNLLGKKSLVGMHVLSILMEQSQDIVTNCKRLNKDASFLMIL